MHTHDSESQQQAVGVAAAVTRIFIRFVCVVISLVFFFLLLLVCVGLVGCWLVCHPACGDNGMYSTQGCLMIHAWLFN